MVGTDRNGEKLVCILWALGLCLSTNGHFLQNPTCVQTHLNLFKKGLRGNFTRLEGDLNVIASYYQNCPVSVSVQQGPEQECLSLGRWGR